MVAAPFQYITIAQTDQLLAYLLQETPVSDWAAISDTIKNKALQSASVIFDSLHWKGNKLWQAQYHQFPRKWARNDLFFDNVRDPSDLDFETFVGDLPYEVAMGLSILAAHLAYQHLNNTEDDDEILALGFSRVTIGSLSVDIESQQTDRAALPDDAETWIKPWAYISKSGKAVSTFRFV